MLLFAYLLLRFRFYSTYDIKNYINARDKVISDIPVDKYLDHFGRLVFVYKRSIDLSHLRILIVDVFGDCKGKFSVLFLFRRIKEFINQICKWSINLINEYSLTYNRNFDVIPLHVNFGYMQEMLENKYLFVIHGVRLSITGFLPDWYKLK
ncbi:hypothetical protein C1646_141129 [Rhizophagus diaphanus]|nr:hypothetical protein C1646_141129 [Rhizophagus diaphanus] [Rhizophagus sp. MUCL 43196]